MPRRFLNRSTFSEETPILDPKPLKNICIDESRNIMQMILDIKFQAELEAHSQRQLKAKSLKKEENNILQLEKSLNFDTRGSRRLIATKGLQLKGKKLIEKVVKDDYDENETPIYPNLLETLLNRMISSAQSVKRNIKKIKGLDLEKEFVPERNHKCEYCKREFSKPCALGGHISKLHAGERAQQRRKEAKMADNFDSPI